MSATQQLAQFIADTSYDSLPADVVAAAKVGILDGVANMLAGSTQPLAAVIGDYVKRMGGSSDSSVVGHGFKTSPPQAAFANGTFLHCLDFEVQGNPPTHGTSASLPPALALAEQLGASGKAVIEAYVVGWEVQARLRTASASANANLRGYHPPGIFGPMGAAASAARMLGMDVSQIGMALGIAASHTGGLTANTGTMVKSTHPGNAARSGTEAALLAQAGFISREGILEARQGYVDVLLGNDFNWDMFASDLGTKFSLVDPGINIKRFPAYIYLQWPTEAVLNLKHRNNLQADDLEYLELELPPVRSDLSRPQPTSGLDGKFSFEYCGAVAMVHGAVGIDSFSDETRFSAEVEKMLPRVRLKVNPEIPTDLLETWVVARAKTRDGREFSEECRSYRGSIRNPMDADDRRAKFTECARRVLGTDDMDKVFSLVEDLENVQDVRQLTETLNPQPSQ